MAEGRHHRVWQIASGNSSRDYSELFLRHDLMLIGPGRYGQYDGDRFRSEALDDGRSSREISRIESFLLEAQEGDLVLLRKGSQAKAIGVVADAPNAEDHWDDSFEDVLGWDLQHFRRVRWQHHLTEQLGDVQR
jgi:hypothetical protein